ncbi:MAG: hypothetical protein HY599_03495 [Candidatus Omnitrophica bacterium]|nr:hypothetical protein [Candidatus Omnitrophota bacterium]
MSLKARRIQPASHHLVVGRRPDRMAIPVGCTDRNQVVGAANKQVVG